MALGPIDRVRLWLARGLIKAAGLPIIPPWVTASFLEPTFRNLVREGYKANGAVFACISALAFSYPEPPYVVTDLDENPLTNHPLRKLLMKPNPIMGEAELKLYTIVYKAIGGNVYWHKVRSEAKRVVELWPYHAAQIRPVPGGEHWISHYEYSPDGSFSPALPVPLEDIVHFKWPAPDPEQPWMALPPLRSVSRETDSDNEMTRYLYALLKNDAVPRTVLVLPKEVTLTDPQYKRLQEQWTELHGGDKRGGMGIVEGGADIKRIGLDLKELAFNALHNVPERRIAAAFRTPMSVAGLGEDPIYANSAEAYMRFTNNTLSPMWVIDASEIQADLAPEFGGEVLVGFDTSKVKALREDMNALWERVDRAVAGGYLMVNEGRIFLGQEEVPGQDVFLRGLNIDEVQATGAKSRRAIVVKGKRANPRRAAAKLGAALQRIRRDVAKKMGRDLDAYFADLSQRVVDRAALRKGLDGRVHAGTKDGKPVLEIKLSERDLLKPEDDKELEKLVKKWYVEVLSASWEMWNLSLGVDVDFDLQDPAVTAVLKGAGTRIKEISDTTREAVRELLQYGSEQGWSIDQIVRGDDEHPGLRAIVEETYKDRARTIARTELGDAQNQATVSRYDEAGVKQVLVLDNGQDDPDEECAALNGTIQTLEWAEAHPLQHPNCTRAFAPIVE